MERKSYNPENNINTSVINIEDVGFSSYDRILFQNLDLHIKTGEVTAVTGKSGSGKTVFLKILAGLEFPEEGRVNINPNIKNVFIPQVLEDVDVNRNEKIIDVLKKTRGLDEIEAQLRLYESKLAESNSNNNNLEHYGKLLETYEKIGGYNQEADMEKVLAGLGISKSKTPNISLDTKLSEVSSGQFRKVMIATALYSNAEIILLDEPTSHLDVASVDWLASYLKTTNSAVVIATNDSRLVDQCCKQTVGLTDSGRVFVFKGGLTEFEVKRDAIIKAEKLEADQASRKLDQLKKTDDMFRSKQVYKRSADMAQVGRALETRMNRLEEEFKNMPGSKQVYNEDKIKDLTFTQEIRSGDDVVLIANVVKKYGEYVAVDLSKSSPISIRRGDKWLFWGPNGSGKSTLAKCVLDSITKKDDAYNSGTVKIGSNVKTGYYTPESYLSNSSGVLIDELSSLVNTKENGRLASILRFFGFSSNMIHRQDIRTLSSGEQKRFSLATLMASSPNFIILDEPTGDYMTKEIKGRLAKALNSFDGTFVVISHDREFIDLLDINKELNLPQGKIILKK